MLLGNSCELLRLTLIDWPNRPYRPVNYATLQTAPHTALQPLFSNDKDEALHRNGIFRCRLKRLGAMPVFVHQRVVGTVVIVQPGLACNHARKPPLFATEGSVTLLRMFMCSANYTFAPPVFYF